MVFHEGEIAVQARVGVRESAEEVGEIVLDRILDDRKRFLERQQMVMLGTIDTWGCPWASVSSSASGLIQVFDERHVSVTALPSASDPLRDNLAVAGHLSLVAPELSSGRRLRLNGRGQIVGESIQIEVAQVYGNCAKYVQHREIVGLRDLSHCPSIRTAYGSRLSADQAKMLSAADTFFIATDHPYFGGDISHKGGDPGFVRIVDEQHLTYPDYPGNRMFNTLGNITINPRAGLLFIEFELGRTIQLTGSASIDWDPVRAEKIAGAGRMVDFEIEQIVDKSCGFGLRTQFISYSKYNPRF